MHSNNKGVKMEKEKIIDKIKKLLSITKENKASESEAAKAAEMAAKLLTEHNLSLGDVTSRDAIDPMDREFHFEKTVPWERTVMTYAAELYFCKAYTSKSYLGIKVAFVGRKSNREVARLMADYFIETINRMADDELATSTANQRIINSAKHAFREGVTSGLCSRIREIINNRKKEEVSVTGNTLPIHISESTAVSAYLDSIGVKLSQKTRKTSVRNAAAFYKGKDKAKDISLNDQVTQNKNRKLLA